MINIFFLLSLNRSFCGAHINISTLFGILKLWFMGKRNNQIKNKSGNLEKVIRKFFVIDNGTNSPIEPKLT